MYVCTLNPVCIDRQTERQRERERERERESIMVLYILKCLVAKEDLDLEALLQVFHGRIILAHNIVGCANRAITTGDQGHVNPVQTHSQQDFLGFLKRFSASGPIASAL